MIVHYCGMYIGESERETCSTTERDIHPKRGNEAPHILMVTAQTRWNKCQPPFIYSTLLYLEHSYKTTAE